MSSVDHEVASHHQALTEELATARVNLTRLAEENANKQQQLDSLQRQLNELTQEIESLRWIQSSRLWRWVEKYYTVRRRLGRLRMGARPTPVSANGSKSVDPPLYETFDVQKFFSVKLVDMAGVVSPYYRGIQMPQQDIKSAKFGLTQQFTENAQTYHEHYFALDYYRWLLQTALSRINVAPAPIVLNVGSGSGNTVIPFLDLVPHSQIIATDLSEQLLAILRDYNLTTKQSNRVALVCMDATKNYLRPNSVDLVVGSAILHHLIDPVLGLQAVSAALKPGTAAIFFEPFENGHASLRLIYSDILRQHQAGHQPALSQPAADLLAALVRDIEVRTGDDKTDPIYAQLDDKWLFTHSYLEMAAHQSQLELSEIYPLHETITPFTDKTRVFLSLLGGSPDDNLPTWAWETIKRYEQGLSDETKTQLLIEGCIILTKN